MDFSAKETLVNLGQWHRKRPIGRSVNDEKNDPQGQVVWSISHLSYKS